MRTLSVIIVIFIFLSCWEKGDDEIARLQKRYEKLEQEYSVIKKMYEDKLVVERESRQEKAELRKSLNDTKKSFDEVYEKLNNKLSREDNPYNGIWLDINDNGEVDFNHFVVIDVLGVSALVLDIRLEGDRVIKNAFNTSYSENGIVWPASPFSFTFEHYLAGELEDKPAYFSETDSILKVVSSYYIPDSSLQGGSGEAYYIKLESKNMDLLLKALEN